MEIKKRVFNLGPDVFGKSSIDKNLRSVIYGNYEVPLLVNKDLPDFVLTKEEWLTIQRYVEGVKKLPTTKDELKGALNVIEISESDFNEFKALIEAYKEMKEHVMPWKNTYEKSVDLASDIYNYSLSANSYYSPIIQLAKELTENPDDKKTKDKLIALLGVLRNQAIEYQKNSEEVTEEIKKIAGQILNDKIRLSGDDGKSGLVKTYEDKYGSQSQAAKELAKKINNEQVLISKFQKEYEHDVMVAGITPTYCWFLPPYGLVASAIVAGIYGKKAIEALDSIKAHNKIVAKLQEKERATAQLIMLLNQSNIMTEAISVCVKATIPLIQKIQGSWKAIANDIDAIAKGIDQSMEDFLPIIMDVFAKATVDKWIAVGKAADRYRQNAYITIVAADVA